MCCVLYAVKPGRLINRSWFFGKRRTSPDHLWSSSISSCIEYRGTFSPAIKRPGHEGDCLSPSGAAIKLRGAVSSLSCVPAWHAAAMVLRN